MGRLHHLQDSSQRVHLLYSTSDKLDLYVYDTLKARYNCRLDAVLNVDSPSQLKRMADVSLMTSLSSDAWFFNMEYRAVKNLPKILAPMLRDGTGTSVFLLKVRNYGEFKAVKEGLDLQKSALDRALDDRLVSIRDYYARKTQIEQQAINVFLL